MEEELIKSKNLEKENIKITNSFVKELEDQIDFLKKKNETVFLDLNKAAESKAEEFDIINSELEKKINQINTHKEILVRF